MKQVSTPKYKIPYTPQAANPPSAMFTGQPGTGPNRNMNKSIARDIFPELKEADIVQPESNETPKYGIKYSPV